MSITKMLYACFLVLAVLVSQTYACGRRDPQDKPPVVENKPSNKPSTTVTACCVCGQPINLVIMVNNHIQEPFFEIKADVKGHPQRELLHQLEVASTQDKRFRFTAEYYGSLGYMITGLNELSASTVNKTYWHISSQTYANGVPLGVSSYIPQNGEIVMFNFTSYATPDNH